MYRLWKESIAAAEGSAPKEIARFGTRIYVYIYIYGRAVSAANF